MNTNKTKTKEGKSKLNDKTRPLWQRPFFIFTSLLLTLCITTFAFNINKSQTEAKSNQTIAISSTQSKRPLDYFQQPDNLIGLWDTIVPFAKEIYTEEEINAQRLINGKTEDGIITYSPLSKEKEWTSIDVEVITPFSWKWIDLELTKEDGTLSTIHLRRPNWWFKELKADNVGNKIFLNMSEMGIVGYATVRNIRINQLDTRFWDENRKGDYVNRPVTGKFEHESSDVYYLYFADNPEPLGITGSHPIRSDDRNDWIAARDLRIGEKVKTRDGATILKSRKKSIRRQKVYNLEVYKDHNFLVSTDKILVHNSCEEIFNSLFKQAEKVGKQAHDYVNTATSLDDAWNALKNAKGAVHSVSNGVEIIKTEAYTYTKYAQHSIALYGGKGYNLTGTISRQSNTTNNLKKLRFGTAN